MRPLGREICTVVALWLWELWLWEGEIGRFWGKMCPFLRGGPKARFGSGILDLGFWEVYVLFCYWYFDFLHFGGEGKGKGEGEDLGSGFFFFFLEGWNCFKVILQAILVLMGLIGGLM